MVAIEENKNHSEFSYPRFSVSITFPQIDWAGRIFYSRIFELAQTAMEQFFATTELGTVAGLLESGGPLPVVVHAESDYHIPITLGDEISVEVSCVRIGRTSFTLCYDIWKLIKVRNVLGKERTEEVLAGRVKVVHVLVKRNRKMELSVKWKKVLERIHRQDSGDGK